MRKLILIGLFLVSMIGYSQGGPKVDVIKFRGEVTTTVRDTFDVPTGETWLIWNATTGQLETAGSDDVWSSLTSGSSFSTLSELNTILTDATLGDESDFVDLISVQSVGGNKTFTGEILADNLLTAKTILPQATDTWSLGNLSYKWHYLYLNKGIYLTPTDTEPTGYEGGLYFDNSENTLKQYNGTAWEGFATDADLAALAATGTGIVAEGTFTTTASRVYTITHGLGYAPASTRIQAQMLVDGVSGVRATPQIGNITSTTFDIDVDGSTSGLDYAWRIFGTDSATPLSGSEVVSAIDTELGQTTWKTGGSGDITKVGTPVDNQIGVWTGDGTLEGDSGLTYDGTDLDVSGAITTVNVSPTGNEVVNKTALDNELSGYVAGDISGRTGMIPTTNIGAQSQDNYDLDGPPSAGEWVVITDPTPASDFTGTAIPMDGYYQHDDTATDTATWTIGTSKNGGLAEILINLASEPTITGATQITGTTDFAASTLMLLTVKNILGTEYYYFTEL